MVKRKIYYILCGIFKKFRKIYIVKVGERKRKKNKREKHPKKAHIVAFGVRASKYHNVWLIKLKEESFTLHSLIIACSCRKNLSYL